LRNSKYFFHNLFVLLLLKVMRIETRHIPEENNVFGSDALQQFLEGESGYLNFQVLEDDEFYIKNYYSLTR